MAEDRKTGALALIMGGALALSALAPSSAEAQDAGKAVRRPAAARVSARPPATRTAQARPLTIRPRAAVAPVAAVSGPGFFDDYLVRPHGWDDPRLYYFGPFRTGGEVSYGDQAGNPITRGNAGLGQIAGYGGARGGFGGPHLDSVGGFHNGPGPDAKIDSDYASGSLSRPDYAFTTSYPSVKERVAALNTGVAARGDTSPAVDRFSGRRMVAEGRSTTVAFEEAKARFAAPMVRQAPVEAGFANGGIDSIGLGDDAF